MRARFWVESTLGVLALAAEVLTAARPEWIEALTGTQPDGGDGTLEWAIVAALLAAAVVLGVAARREYRRTATA